MVDIADRENVPDGVHEAMAAKRGVPRWTVTVASLVVLVLIWEILGRHVNPIFGAPPSAIFVAFVELIRNGKLAAAL
jgi:ABC-type nitrate/sulfonate/bicarbonate transport system permease component